jgi:formylglycine-generating enzyme required for sulfatase activity
VWRAYDLHDRREVAIKVLHPQIAGDNLRRERFFRGAREMAALEHDAIARVVSPHEHDGGYHYFVMELVRGGTLRRAVLDGRVGADALLAIIGPLGDALAQAHARDLVHRDVKPDNVLLTADGAPKLTDFDLVGGPETTGGTRTGAMGTFIYAAPEMMDRPQDADARADVYALAMTAIFIIHGGKLPRTVLRDAPGFARSLACSPAVAEVLARAVDWSPSVRYADAQAFCAALRAAHDAAPELEARPQLDSDPLRDDAVNRDSSGEHKPTRESDKVAPAGRRRRWLAGGVALAGISSGLLAILLAVGLDENSRYGAPDSGLNPPNTPPLRAADAALAADAAPAAAIAMVKIPEGEFTMGSRKDDAADDDERPAHPVKISAFEMSAHEVTQGLWKAVMDENPSYCFADGCKDDLPVQNVTWFDAIRFSNELSDREGLRRCYAIDGTNVEWDVTCDGYRLPTEAEWEYASRATSTTAYSFGDSAAQLGEYAWYAGDADDQTHPVGSKKPNRWGLHDMHGNVWEWVWDWFGTYPSTAQTDPRGPPDGRYRALRGGSFADGAGNLRSACRFRGVPGFRGRNDGFRLVRGARRQP